MKIESPAAGLQKTIVISDVHMRDGKGCWCLSSSWGHADATPSYVEIVGDQATLVFWRQPG
jgi:hypothetical protein